MTEKLDAQGRTEHEARAAKGLYPAIALRVVDQSVSRITGEPYPVPKVLVSFPDATQATFGGKVAERATHVLLVHSRPAQEGDSDWYVDKRADTWGWWCKGTLATCQKGLADAAKSDTIDKLLIVEIVDSLTECQQQIIDTVASAGKDGAA